MKDFIKALECGEEFDWIAINGYDLSKSELISIIKEYIYAIHNMGIVDGKEDIIDAVYLELRDMYEDEE